MLPWVKADTLELYTWLLRKSFTPAAPCDDELAVVAYRTIVALEKHGEWGRRRFAAHTGLSDFKARRIIERAMAEMPDASRLHPSGIPAASQNLPAASQRHPSRSDDGAENVGSTSQIAPSGIPLASQRHPSRARILDRDAEEERDADGEGNTPLPPRREAAGAASADAEMLAGAEARVAERMAQPNRAAEVAAVKRELSKRPDWQRLTPLWEQASTEQRLALIDVLSVLDYHERVFQSGLPPSPAAARAVAGLLGGGNGYSVAQLRLAVDGAKASDWHDDKPHLTTAVKIFVPAEVDGWIARARKPVASDRTPTGYQANRVHYPTLPDDGVDIAF